MRTLLVRWLADEDGQDLIEYALLAGFLGFAAVAGAGFLGSAMNSTYSIWDSRDQTAPLVEVPDPQ